MQIQKIKIENFKSIYDPIEINFIEVNGFWKIAGEVGAGKTSIGEAIIYGLFGTVVGKNNGDLLSWNRKHGSVEIWCTSKGSNIYIKRELNSYGANPIYAEINGEELVFTNKRDAQIQLEQEYYDTSRVTIELLCIISFNNFKSLATLNTGDTKKFLDQVLGFYILTEYAESCKQLRSAHNAKIKSIQIEIASLCSQIKKLEELSNIDVIEGNIEDLSKTINEQLQTIQTKRKENDKVLEELASRKTSLIKEQSSVLLLGKNKKKEIDFIEKGKCPTCGAPIDQSQLEIKRKEKDILLEKYNDLTSQVEAIGKEEADKKKWFNLSLDVLTSELDVKRKLLHQLEEQAKRESIADSEIEKIRIQVASKETELAKHQCEDAEWESLCDILSSQVRSKILSSFIPALNNNISKYVARLQLPYSVEFDSSFKCNISLCGMDKNIPISSLSTGQLKTVDMVTILGVLGTIIGSNGLNILFLDELFSNLDYDRRNEMCGVLRETLKGDQSIFIISHMDVDDQYFDGVISLSLENRDGFEKHTCCKIQKIKRDR